jgi:hypothetical protein
MVSNRKIWLGVGAFVVAGAGAMDAANPLAADPSGTTGVRVSHDRAHAAGRMPDGRFVVAQHEGHAAEATTAPEATDGGEGGEAGVAELPPDLAFAARFVLLRGHLHVGGELVALGQWDAALPHFLHPSEEIYADIKDELEAYQTPPFEDALKTLSDIVKSKRAGPGYAGALKIVQDAGLAADAGMKRKHGDNWPSFVTSAAVEAIKTAAGEYQNAIVGGRIAKPVEYQDARGFILEADRMIESVAPALATKDAAALQQVRAAMAELKAIFPQVLPPRVPIKDYGEMLATVSRVELAAGNLM